MTRNRRLNHDSFHKLNDIPDEQEDYGFEIQNSKRQHKHKTQKFKQREEYYDDWLKSIFVLPVEKEFSTTSW